MADAHINSDTPFNPAPEQKTSIRRFRPTLVQTRPVASRNTNTVPVLGFDLASMGLSEAADWLVKQIKTSTQTRLSFLNAHCANVARDNWRYAAALRTSGAIFPDGSGVAMAAKLTGQSLAGNLNGTDLFHPLCHRLAQNKMPLFLLGGRSGVARLAAEKAQAQHPDLIIAGAEDGYFEPQDEEHLIQSINKSGAKVVMAAMGVPDQDIWLARVAPRLDASLVMGVGGLFDFVSGQTSRAPKWLRKLGMEWTWRLACEPRRMWRRYLIGNVSFTCAAIAHALETRSKSIAQSVSLGLKRIFDIGVASCALLFLSPIMLGTAIAVAATSKGPVLFRQKRVGEDGATFEMLKFRSMVVDAETQRAKLLEQSDREGVTFKMKHDPRITPVGGLIRKFSIDELPQIINVLKGDMSLVGPRPALPEEVSRYDSRAMGRLAGKPGITGIWQVSGRANISFDQMVDMDRDYLKTRSFWTDVVIMLRTPMVVLSGEGAY